jgi:hypothetical protein
MAPSRESTSGRCCGASRGSSRSTGCAASTCSTRETATCTRSSSTTARSPTSGSAERFGTDVLLACLELGGTITGEHGIGLEKLDAACAQFTAAERAVLLAIKAAFDPAGLLNPGKAIPTLHRCAELGRVRARDGALPHPDLPRF